MESLLAAALPILGTVGKSILPSIGKIAGNVLEDLSPEAKAAFCDCKDKENEAYKKGFNDASSDYSAAVDDYGYVNNGQRVILKPRRKRHLRQDRMKKF